MCFVFFVVMKPFEPTFFVFFDPLFLDRSETQDAKGGGLGGDIGWERGQQRIAKGGLGGVLKREAFGKG